MKESGGRITTKRVKKVFLILKHSDGDEYEGEWKKDTQLICE